MQIQTHPSFSACYHYLQVSKGSNQKQPRKKWRHHFPHYKSMGVFFRCSRADNSVVVVLSGLNSSLFKIICMSLLPLYLKWIGSIATEKKG